MQYEKFAKRRSKKKWLLVVPLLFIVIILLISKNRDKGPQTAEESVVCHFSDTRDSGGKEPAPGGAATAYAKDNGYGIAAGGELTRRNQKELDLYFRELQELGVTWVRWDVDWSAIQPNNDKEYDWTGTDRVSASARRYGIRSLGIITYAPDWAEDGSCPATEKCPPEDAATFARFARAAAERYRDSVSAWEIWNEPNHKDYWYPAPDAGDYTRILSAAYGEIKAADPDAIVVSAGLTDMDTEDGVSISPEDYVNYMYEAGAKDHFDVLALHPYTYPGYDYGWPQISSIWKLTEKYGDQDVKIWITEYGAPTGGAGHAVEIGQSGFSYGKDFMSEKAQSTMAESMFSFKAAHPDHIGNVFWYTLCDSDRGNSSTENFFGIIRFDGTKKMVYNTIKGLLSRL